MKSIFSQIFHRGGTDLPESFSVEGLWPFSLQKMLVTDPTRVEHSAEKVVIKSEERIPPAFVSRLVFPIPDGLKEGDEINWKVSFPQDRISINLRNRKDTDAVLYHWNPRKNEKQLVQNTLKFHWGREERLTITQPMVASHSAPITGGIKVLKDHLVVSCYDQTITYKHRYKIEEAQVLTFDEGMTIYSISHNRSGLTKNLSLHQMAEGLVVPHASGITTFRPIRGVFFLYLPNASYQPSIWQMPTPTIQLDFESVTFLEIEIQSSRSLSFLNFSKNVLSIPTPQSIEEVIKNIREMKSLRISWPEGLDKPCTLEVLDNHSHHRVHTNLIKVDQSVNLIGFNGKFVLKNVWTSTCVDPWQICKLLLIASQDPQSPFSEVPLDVIKLIGNYLL